LRREPEFWGDRPLDLLFIGKKLAEALAVEKILTDAGVDYAVEVDYYVGGLLFRSERAGAFVYVEPSDWDRAARLVSEGGYRPAERPASV